MINKNIDRPWETCQIYDRKYLAHDFCSKKSTRALTSAYVYFFFPFSMQHICQCNVEKLFVSSENNNFKSIFYVKYLYNLRTTTFQNYTAY